MINKTNIIEFVSCFVFSILGFLGCAFIFDYLRKIGLDIDFGGDKSSVFLGLIIGVPLFGFLGVYLADKFFLGASKFSFLSLVSVILFNLLGCVLIVFLMDILGSKILFISPFILTLLILIGYKLPLFFKK